MARYIDVNKLIARLPVVGVDGTDPLVSIVDVRRIIALATAETGDVVEVVRCKDCEHYRDRGCFATCQLWTVNMDAPTDPNAFCMQIRVKDV